ncbi:MAG: hypothetical protein JW755_12225 [Candidatus Aminicenantes bacterium]|nr:hypothetical protein [Candidatus Aminicenantes bacterium]
MRIHPSFYYLSSILVIIFILSLTAFLIPDRKSSLSLDLFTKQNQNSERGERGIGLEKEEDEKDFHLTYRWRNLKNQHNVVSFKISKTELKTAEDEFGYYPQDLELFLSEKREKMKTEMIEFLKKFTQEKIDQSKYSEYISIREIDSGSFTLHISVPPPMYKEVKAEFDQITGELAKEQTKYFKKIEDDQRKHQEIYLNQRGLRFIGDKIGVDYGMIVARNRPRLAHVVEKMLEISRSTTLHEILDQMLSFIQEIKYGLPPLSELNKLILEFWVPPRVLVNNMGDCDSKGVAFAALWTNFKKYPLLLIKIPNHMFLGLAIPSFQEGGITINGLKYTLFEITGPEKTPPGMISAYSRMHLEGGNYIYELIR